MPNANSNFHIPVLLKEVVECLDPKPNNIVIDGTLGGGGHALEIAKRIGKGILIGIDLDPEAVRAAKNKFAAEKVAAKVILVQGNYKDLDRILADNGIEKADRILIDIGISSYDLEASSRGFSFQHENEPLDMRFNPEEEDKNKSKEPFTAKFILKRYSEKELGELFKSFGEEKFARQIARAIVRVRQESPIQTTTDLFELIKKSLPAPVKYKAGDSARRIFQALRIEVNQELNNLSEFLPRAFNLLNPEGRLAVISFHSLEDRIVKHFFLDKAKGCICPPEFPECRCGRNPEGKIITRKPVTATEEETKENSRSASAKLRVIQKI